MCASLMRVCKNRPHQQRSHTITLKQNINIIFISDFVSLSLTLQAVGMVLYASPLESSIW